MTIQYTPRGVCSRSFQIEVEDGVIRSVQVVGGRGGPKDGGNPLRWKTDLLPRSIGPSLKISHVNKCRP